MLDCLFCKIARGEIYEDDELFAFHDIKPQAPIHFLVIPKRHIENVMGFSAEDSDLAGRLIYKARELAAGDSHDGRSRGQGNGPFRDEKKSV
ncbi:MAG: HIT domain-containing protein [Treponemataceae bacterium]